jgi:hypothetical protein
MSDVPNPVPTSFTPDDILAAVMLIDHACNEGAYRGWEIVNTAYSVRSRLIEFAESWRSINQALTEGEQK